MKKNERNWLKEHNMIIFGMFIFGFFGLMVFGNRSRMLEKQKFQMESYLEKLGYEDVKYINSSSLSFVNSYTASNAVGKIEVTITNDGTIQEKPYSKSKLIEELIEK